MNTMKWTINSVLNFIAYFILSITCGYSSWYNKNLDINDILEQYVAVCGHDYLCDKSIIPSHLRSNISYKDVIPCPPCSCDGTCLSQNNCCPDIFMSFPAMSCARIDVEGFQKRSSDKYLIIEECPFNSTETQDDLCQQSNISLVQKLLTPPVTSNTFYRLTFKNKYCAQCNGYNSYNQWSLDIQCEEFADFNYLSSYDEIVELAAKKSCIVSFKPPYDNDAVQCSDPLEINLPPYVNTDKCNVTAALKVSNTGIEAMCNSNYKLIHSLIGNDNVSFKNIFCYICNPLPYYDNDVISTCNTTAVWSYKDISVELSCQKYPAMAVSYPFKNIFCKICNLDSRLPIYLNDTVMYLDAEAVIRPARSYELSTGFHSGKMFSYYVSIRQFEVDYLLKMVDNILHNYDETGEGVIYNDVFTKYENRNSVNLTNLFLKRHAYYPDIHTCDNKWDTLNISHWKSCPESDIECKLRNCYDFHFIYPTSCYPLTLGRDGPYSVMVVDGCINISTGTMQKRYERLCEHLRINNTLYNYVPIENSGSPVVYKNIFCAICNFNKTRHRKHTYITLDDSVRRSPIKRIKREISIPSTNSNNDRKVVYGAIVDKHPFGIHMTCRTFLDVTTHITLNSLLEMSHNKAKCSINFRPHSNLNNCRKYQFDIGKCNITGQWTNYDTDIEHACEKIDRFDVSVVSNKNWTFKNEYCEMCNPVFWNGTVIDTCNVTGQWTVYDLDTEQACQLFPLIYSMSPFKNYFCALCNGHKLRRDIISPMTGLGGSRGDDQTNYSLRMDGNDRIMPVQPLISLRSLFSLLEYGEVSSADDKGGQCRADQLYDQSVVWKPYFL